MFVVSSFVNTLEYCWLSVSAISSSEFVNVPSGFLRFGTVDGTLLVDFMYFQADLGFVLHSVAIFLSNSFLAFLFSFEDSFLLLIPGIIFVCFTLLGVKVS